MTLISPDTGKHIQECRPKDNMHSVSVTIVLSLNDKDASFVLICLSAAHKHIQPPIAINILLLDLPAGLSVINWPTLTRQPFGGTTFCSKNIVI